MYIFVALAMIGSVRNYMMNVGVTIFFTFVIAFHYILC